MYKYECAELSVLVLNDYSHSCTFHEVTGTGAKSLMFYLLCVCVRVQSL